MAVRNRTGSLFLVVCGFRVRQTYYSTKGREKGRLQNESSNTQLANGLSKARALAQKARESGRERRVLVQRLVSDKARALDWCAPPALPHKCSQNSLGHFTFCSVTGKVVVVVSRRLRLRSATFRAAKSRRDRAPHQPCTQDTDKTTPTAQPSLPGFTAGVGPKSHLVPGFERDTDAARLDMHTQTQAQVTHTFCRRGDRLQALQCWRSCPQGMRQ